MDIFIKALYHKTKFNSICFIVLKKNKVISQQMVLKKQKALYAYQKNEKCRYKLINFNKMSVFWDNGG